MHMKCTSDNYISFLLVINASSNIHDGIQNVMDIYSGFAEINGQVAFVSCFMLLPSGKLLNCFERKWHDEGLVNKNYSLVSIVNTHACSEFHQFVYEAFNNILVDNAEILPQKFKINFKS
jgi:hypothetical protein